MRDFGKHLMMDCHRCQQLDDMQAVYDVLDKLSELLGMTKIMPPYVFPYSGLVPEDAGITGVVVIAESHITIHTFTLKDFLFVDVFSCNPFDVELAKQYVLDAFCVAACDAQTATRGKGFPR